MEYKLLDRLSKATDYNDDLINILFAIKNDVQHASWDTLASRLILYLISLTCQNRYAQYTKPNVQVFTININNINKKIHEYCLDLIADLLIKILKCKQGAAEKITDLYIDHLENHSSCLGALGVLYRLIYFSDKLLPYYRENHTFQIFLELFEKNVIKMLKDFENEDRFALMIQTLRNPATLHDTQDFHTQLSKYVQQNFPSAYQNTTSERNVHSPLKERSSDIDFGFQSDSNLNNLNLKLGSVGGNMNEHTMLTECNDLQKTSEQNSFMKKVKIPPLNIPSSNSENNNNNNFGTITRSTRRADPFKSFSTNSNRFSNSIDSGFKSKALAPKNANENNLSLLENDNSYFYEDKDDKLLKNASPMEKMKELARSLGEYNLTIDLGQLLALKRKVQLDQVAKIASFQEVDSLMDLKIDESFIKERIQKRKQVRTHKGSIKKSDIKFLQDNDQITMLDSLEIKAITASQESLLISSRETQNEFRISTTANNIKKRKNKQDLNTQRKICKLFANILFHILKDLDTQKLEFLSSPINVIYMYLSSEINMRNRRKDLLKVICSRKGWNEFQEIEFEMNKINSICEGIDNVEGINRHYEKIKIDLYKAKIQKLNSNNSNNSNKQNSTETNKDQNYYIGPFNSGNQKPNPVYNKNEMQIQNLLNTKQPSSHDSNLKKQSDNTGQFSTSFDNTNSQYNTLNDESTYEFQEEFTLHDKNVLLDNILLPEYIVYFKILNFYSISTEKIHETLSLMQNIASSSYPEAPTSDLIYNKPEEKAKILGNMKTYRSNPTPGTLLIRGLSISLENSNISELKNLSNSFLAKFEKRFMWYMNNIDINNQIFFEIQREQLDILDSFLANNSTRIICYEVIEYMIEIMLMLKRQFIELSLPNISNRTGHNSVRITTPLQSQQHLQHQQLQQQQQQQQQSNSKNTSASKFNSYTAPFYQTSGGNLMNTNPLQIPNLNHGFGLLSIPSSGPTNNNSAGTSASASSTSAQAQLSNLFKPVVKISQNGSRLIIDSPSKVQQTQGSGGIGGVSLVGNGGDKSLSQQMSAISGMQQNSTMNLQMNLPFVLRHREMFSLYLMVLARIVLKSPRNEIYKLLNQIFFNNEIWKDLVKMYTQHIFNEVLANCDEVAMTVTGMGVGSVGRSEFSNDVVNLYLSAQRLLFYFKSILIMCQNLIFKEKLNEKKTDKSKEWKYFVRKVFQEFLYLVKPGHGLFAKYLNVNSVLNSMIIVQQKEKLPIPILLRINLYNEIFQFLRLAFSFTKVYSCMLNEDISGFYLKFSFINFVKLYSHSNANELNEISSKIKELNNRMKQSNQGGGGGGVGGAGQYNNNKNNNNENIIKDNINDLLNKGAEEPPSKIEKYYKYFKVRLLNQYVSVLFALSTTRTEDISRKFYQYRIVEFFTREIDLEFDIMQIRQRFLRIRKEAKQNKTIEGSNGGSVQGYNEQNNNLQGQQQIGTKVGGQESSPFALNLGKQSNSNTKNKTNKQDTQKPQPIPQPQQQQQQQTVAKGKMKIPMLNFLNCVPSQEKKEEEIVKNNLVQNNNHTQPILSRASASQQQQQQQQHYQGQTAQKNKLLNGGGGASSDSDNDIDNKQQSQKHPLLQQTCIQPKPPSQQQQQQAKNNRQYKRVPIPKLNVNAIPIAEGQKQQQGTQSQPLAQQQQQQVMLKTFNNEDYSEDRDESQILVTDHQQTQQDLVEDDQSQLSGQYLQTQSQQQQDNQKSKKMNIPQLKIPGLNTNQSGLGNCAIEPQYPQQTQQGPNKKSQAPKVPMLNFNSIGGTKEQGSVGVDAGLNLGFGQANAQDQQEEEQFVQPSQQLQGQQNSKNSKASAKLRQVTQYMDVQAGEETELASKSQQGPNQKQHQQQPEKQEQSPVYSMNKSNFKMQLVLENSKLNCENMSIKGIQQHLNQHHQQLQNQQDAHHKLMPPSSSAGDSSSHPGEQDIDEILNENIFYYSERRLRKLYSDDQLHANFIALIISLLLTPERGTLDELYCSQNPILYGKPNILYLLHFHLNHPSNQHILPLLLKRMSDVKPFPAGERMMKLLCTSLTDTSIYFDQKKIASGAYGTIYECSTKLTDPQTVAIKQMSIPKSIYERCVLHDIFTEITCLENFRLDPCVTDLYDYGVTETDYIIVMKRYPTSLKEWRLQQKGSWQDNLSMYLTLYRDILKSVQLLHSHNVTHYDLKADNILLDTKSVGPSSANVGGGGGVGYLGNVSVSYYGGAGGVGGGGGVGGQGSWYQGEQNIRVVLGDFGECKMFKNEEDEYCLRSRGTEFIKSPEMLTLTINSKKEGDKYDRRKKVGTTRVSDIWSLGCLLYEILTGEFLFYHPEWAQFYIKVTTPSEVLLTEEKLEKIGNNVYIIDFLKYVLVREQNIRPSIDNIVKRFEHIYALLVSTTNPTTNYSADLSTISNASIPVNWSLEGVLENYEQLIFPSNESIPEKTAASHKLKHCPTFLKIMEEIYICSKSYFIQNKEKLILNGITHVITEDKVLEKAQLNRFHYFFIEDQTSFQFQSSSTAPYRLAHRVMDYLREIFLFRGKVLFVEDDDISINSEPNKLLLRTTLLFCLTNFFKCSVFETWTLINSQVLFFQIPQSCLQFMSTCITQLFRIESYLDSFPKSQCICGCTTFILKRNFNCDKKTVTKVCNCSKDNKQNDISDCPSDGCTEYLKFIKKKYKLQWESLKWTYLSPSSFLIGPFNSGQISDDNQIQIIQNSEGPTYNCVSYKVSIDKKEDLFYQMNDNEWTIYKCKVCHMWMFALNTKNTAIAFITNNIIKRNRQGIMIPNSQQNFKIKTPVLRHFNLYELKQQ